MRSGCARCLPSLRGRGIVALDPGRSFPVELSLAAPQGSCSALWLHPRLSRSALSSERVAATSRTKPRDENETQPLISHSRSLPLLCPQFKSLQLQYPGVIVAAERLLFAASPITGAVVTTWREICPVSLPDP